MITAELKGIYTIEMKDLNEYVPDDRDCFVVVVRAMVGPRGSEGEESFDITVCTPAWLEKEVSKYGFVLGTHCLIVQEYSHTFIRQVIKKFVERSSGESWQEVAEKIARIGTWEFEDHPG